MRVIDISLNYADNKTPEEVYEYLRCVINSLSSIINILKESTFEQIDVIQNEINELEKICEKQDN